MDSTKIKIKDVFIISDRDTGKSDWQKIGVAFVNKDNSLNIVLDALPINGRMHIRDRKAAQNQEAA